MAVLVLPLSLLYLEIRYMEPLWSNYHFVINYNGIETLDDTQLLDLDYIAYTRIMDQCVVECMVLRTLQETEQYTYSYKGSQCYKNIIILRQNMWFFFDASLEFRTYWLINYYFCYISDMYSCAWTAFPDICH